ncbi:MAG: ABC transporter substrate-binding protein [Blautia sp.]|nr:ABC transporter substrate-binding protein [Blautia sp.]
MKRKVMAIALCAATAASMLAPMSIQAADGEITEIFWQYPTTLDTNTDGFYEVEDALNEMMEKDIGVHVTFVPVGLMESQNEAILEVAAGEQLDIMLSAFTTLGNVVSKGLILPLDELLDEYGQAILENSHSKEMCGYQGQTYGVCTGDTVTDEYGYMIKKKYWDKYNLAEETGWTEDKIYTMEELEHIFEIVKAGEGDNFYCDVPWNTTQEPMNNGWKEYDKVGGSLATGVLMLNRSFTDTTIYDLFETEEYKEYCEMRYDWAQKGYIAADAAVTTEAPDTLVAQDNYLGVCYWALPQDMITYDRTIGEELVCLDMVPRYGAYKGGSVIQWSIPITSASPEKAVQALNYIYENPEAAWLIEYGLEGVEYEVVDEKDGLKQIRFLADDVQSLPYYMPYGIWGNVLQWPDLYPAEIGTNAKKQALEDAMPEERNSPAFGYSFDQAPVATQVAAVNTVIEQYTPTLNCGALDPEQVLPEFIDSLKAAGMDEIIAEQQSQFDAWLAGKAAE